MKRILATTTILAMSAGFAAAEVTLSGDARMGIISDFGGADAVFTSRARVTFTLSGESDSGFSFGASFGAHEAEGAAEGEAGSVWIEGAFGKLSMGDVDHGDKAAVGNISGVGLTDLGDLNEVDYDNSNTTLPRALYEYSTGGLAFYLSVGLDNAAPSNSYGVGVKYSTDTFAVALGYGQDSDEDTQVSVSASANLGAATVKAIYSQYDAAWGPFTADEMGMSVDYTAGAATITAFYMDSDWDVGPAYGLGASYDLGGGASLVGGVAVNGSDDTAWDLGLSFSF